MPYPDARFDYPGFPRKPRVIDAADRATGAREKHGAAPKALAVSLDAGRNRVSGLRTFDHDHSHVALPRNWSLLFSAEKHRPVGVRLLSVRVLGGHRAPCMIEHRPVGAACSLLGLFQP